jgi:hypothetical protein
MWSFTRIGKVSLLVRALFWQDDGSAYTTLRQLELEVSKFSDFLSLYARLHEVPT